MQIISHTSLIKICDGLPQPLSLFLTSCGRAVGYSARALTFFLRCVSVPLDESGQVPARGMHLCIFSSLLSKNVWERVILEAGDKEQVKCCDGTSHSMTGRGASAVNPGLHQGWRPSPAPHSDPAVTPGARRSRSPDTASRQNKPASEQKPTEPAPVFVQLFIQIQQR